MGTACQKNSGSSSRVSALELSLKFHPATPIQSGFFWAARSDPFHATHTEQLGLDFEGCLDFRNIETALQGIVIRQPALRTSFGTEGGVVLAREHPLLPFLPLEERDLTVLSDSSQTEFIETDEDMKRHRLFDLNQPPLFLVTVYRKATDCFRLTLTFHHIITDGWSLCAIVHELVDEALSPRLGKACGRDDECLKIPETTVPLIPPVKPRLGFRREFVPTMPLPYDGTKETVPVYGFYQVVLGAEETSTILERDHVLSLSGKWLQWTAQWLLIVTGLQEVCFSTAVSTRIVTDGDAQGHSIPLGCYVSLQLIRSTGDPQSIREEMRRVIHHVRSGTPTGASTNKQIISVFEKMPMEYHSQGLSLCGVSLHNTTGFDISIQGWIFKDCLHIEWNYRRDRFSLETIQRLVRQFLSVKGLS